MDCCVVSHAICHCDLFPKSVFFILVYRDLGMYLNIIILIEEKSWPRKLSIDMDDGSRIAIRTRDLFGNGKLLLDNLTLTPDLHRLRCSCICGGNCRSTTQKKASGQQSWGKKEHLFLFGSENNWGAFLHRDNADFSILIQRSPSFQASKQFNSASSQQLWKEIPPSGRGCSANLDKIEIITYRKVDECHEWSFNCLEREYGVGCGWKLRRQPLSSPNESRDFGSNTGVGGLEMHGEP